MKEIGKIVAVHGVEGQLVISHRVSNYQQIKRESVLLLEIWPESFIPFFIEKIGSVTNDSMAVKFEEINSREEARKFVGKKVFIKDGHILQTINADEWGFLTGYAVIDQQGTKVGNVEDILSYGLQMLIETTYKSKKIHVPLHPDLIVHLDRDNKLIQMHIENGLLEMWD